ncbi:MAG: hypothetical protein QXX55_00330 [Candidatus Pacearchaeota archaeon]
MDINYKKIIFSFGLFLLTIFYASAVEIETKSEFLQGETLIAIVSGIFLDQITLDNVHFYQDNIEIPVEYNIGKINNEFYIYASLIGKSPGNYSIIIKGVRYMNGTLEKDSDIIKNFKIKNEVASFSVKPGFVNTQDNFYLELQNLLNKKIKIDIKTSENISSVRSVELLSGEIKRINFFLETEKRIFEKINLSSNNIEYSIPIFFEGLEIMNQENVTIRREENSTLRFEPRKINISIATNSTGYKKIIYVLNNGSIKIENISFIIPNNLKQYLDVSPKKINSLEANSAGRVEIIINSSSRELKIEGEIIAQANNITDSLKILINFINDYISENGDEKEEILVTCSQLGGNFCNKEQRCSGDSVNTSDTVDVLCCLNNCEKVSESGSTGKIIGWTLVILILIFLSWFFIKYKKVRPKTNLIKIAEGEK